MGMTMVEKVLARTSGRSRVAPGDIVVCKVDTAVQIDIVFSGGGTWYEPTRVFDPDRIVVIMDHGVPAPNDDYAHAGVVARRFVRKFGIKKFFDVGQHGIAHQVVVEQGLALPGQLLACADSHTCSVGALNCAGRGLGPPEMLQVVCKGQAWYRVMPTIRIELEGELRQRVTAKDVFFHLAGMLDAQGHNLEFHGPGVTGLSIAERQTLATMSAELNAEFAMFPADQVTLAYLEDRAVRPFEPVAPDPDAAYAQVIRVDMSSLEPMVARPDRILGNVAAAREVMEEGIPIDQAFIGSCANGQLEDLAAAAEILHGRQVAPGVRLIVTPASQQVYLEAVRAGIVETLTRAGAVVTNSTCGACMGIHLGVLGPGETCISSSTRNFKGRMGSPEARVFLASPATVAASAVTGRITDPRSL